jgi:cytochrome c-type biogenesis protein CcmE
MKPRHKRFALIGGIVANVVAATGLVLNAFQVEFAAIDTAQTINVKYVGILRDLVQEGKGVVAQGQLQIDGAFVAREVLAKHDENYMPPEAAEALKRAKQTNEKIANTVSPGATP